MTRAACHCEGRSDVAICFLKILQSEQYYRFGETKCMGEDQEGLASVSHLDGADGEGGKYDDVIRGEGGIGTA